MPGMPGVPLADLSPQLLSLLLRCCALLIATALVLAVLAAFLYSRHNSRYEALSTRWLGTEQFEPVARRRLRIGLGLLWLVDGLLQAQPRMPAGFIPQVVNPGIQASPRWLADLIKPLAQVWTNHPVAADAITVWVQIGLGLLILSGGRGGLLARLSLWASLGWTAVVWVAGEFLGGLTQPGASWLMGAPGAVLVYAVAAALLLGRRQRWESGSMTRVSRRSVAIWFIVAAALQALPWEGNWSANGLAAAFEDGANTAQPAALLRPIRATLTLARLHPIAMNLVLVSVLVMLGVGLWLRASRMLIVVGLALCAATWWLSQDFGVLGGLGTDPNTALPLALILATAWPRRGEDRAPVAGFADSGNPGRPQLRFASVKAGAAAVGVGAVLLIPLVLAASLIRPADATAAIADSGGGVIAIPHRAAPDFSLPDQNGQVVSMSSARGKLVLLTFLDPVCSDDCPIIANQIAAADRQLGSLADQVQIVAVDSNPVFHNVADVAAFTTSHGLGDLPNWHYVAGSQTALHDVLDAYGMVVQVPTVGMISHSDGIYFVTPDGNQVAYLGDGANPDLGTTYTTLIGDEVRKLLR
jgi:cytochrome oxidase Cu insertion factor (SCO1/SenC/PrrC family)